MPRVPLPDVGVTSIRETCTASSEDITPRSSLLRTHASIPCRSPLLRLLASFAESSQVATSPAATGILPTLSLRILPQMPEPMPRRFAECICLVLPQHSSAFPIIRLGRLPASFREHDFPRVGFRGCSYFVMFRPPSLLASQIVPTAASSPAGQPRLFTSEQNVRRYLRTHRTCYPPDSRQLAERELSSRKIRSLVGCYRMMPPFPWSPLSSVQRVFPINAGRSVDQTVRLTVVYEGISHRAVGIRPSCTSLPVASYPPFRVGGLMHHRSSGLNRFTPGGPHSGPDYSVLGHRRLIGPCAPLAGTSRLHRTAVYTRCPRCASKLQRLGDPRVVPCFRWLSSIDMSPSETAGSSSAACTQFLRR